MKTGREGEKGGSELRALQSITPATLLPARFWVVLILFLLFFRERVLGLSLSHGLISNSSVQAILLPQPLKQLGLQGCAIKSNMSLTPTAPGGRPSPVCPFYRTGELRVPAVKRSLRATGLGCGGLA